MEIQQSGQSAATVVVCVVDGETVDAVVPASLAVNLDRLLDLAGGRAVRLASEDEAGNPTVTPLSTRRVFVDVLLAAEPAIALPGVADRAVVVLRWAEFARTVRPIVGKFAEPRRDRVPSYRLSYRE